MQTEYHVLVTLYRRFGSLGVFSRLFGQFPVHGSLAGNRLLLGFSFFSCATLYSFLCFAIPLAYSEYWYLTVRLTTSQSIFLEVGRIAASLAVLGTFLHGWTQVCQLMLDMDHFDTQVYSLPVFTKIRKTDRGFAWVVAPMMQLMYAILSQNFIFRIPAMNLVNAIFFIYPILQLTLFLVFCRDVSDRISLLQTSWLKYLKIAVTQNHGEANLRLDDYRILQGKLLKCVTSLNAAFGARLTAAYIIALYAFILGSYLCLQSQLTIFFVFGRVLFFGILVLVGSYSSKMQANSNFMLERMFDLRICGKNDLLRFQMDILAYQLYSSRVSVHVPGLFAFSKGFVGSFVIVLVSYFVVVSQVIP